MLKYFSINQSDIKEEKKKKKVFLLISFVWETYYVFYSVEGEALCHCQKKKITIFFIVFRWNEGESDEIRQGLKLF